MGELGRPTRIRARWGARSLLPGPWLVATFGVLLACALTAVLTAQLLPSRYALNEGDVSPYDIKSPAKVTYVSQVRTAQERSRAAAAVPDVYRSIPDAPAKAQAAAAAALTEIGRIRHADLSDAQKAERINQIEGLVLSPSVTADILTLDDTQWQDVVTSTLHLVDRTMRLRITANQLVDVRGSLPAQVDAGLNDRQMSAVVGLARNFIQPTEEVDPGATAEARQEAANNVPPVRISIEKGETILRNGDIVTIADLEKLEAVGLRNPTIRWPEIEAMALISVGLATLVALYLHRFQPSLATNPRRLLLLGVLIVGPVLAAKLTVPGRELYAYLFPIAAAPMLLTILLDAPTSLVATAAQAVALGLVVSDSLELIVATLIAGGLGALVVHRFERVSSLWTAALVVSVATFGVIVSFHLPSGDLDPEQLILFAFLALIGGGLSVALTLGTVAFLGHVFGIATPLNLLDLAHPSHPLFRRLLIEAPGTYHHSVVVANLAERAAAAIGADTLLCRIGGYYHDIGKLVRPYAFIENQVDGQNVHDQLDAHTSARLILAHVADGLELAAKHGVPARIQDMIAQHHGTTTVQYFYWQACQGAEGAVDEASFRYRGPRPQTREAGIMMLADGVEATVRASRDHSSENIAATVDRIIQERISQGQLDECDLTLADLQKIRASFLSVLQGIFHPRVEYPIERVNPARVAGGGR